MSTPLHATLWNDTKGVAEACRDHSFVQGMGSGTLDPGAFKRYVAQDAFFLRAFFSAYALAAARVADRPTVAGQLHELMGGVLAELNLHDGYARELGIDLSSVEPNGATRAYTDFLMRVAWGGDVGEVMAAMTPCMRLYSYLGQELAPGDHSRNPYRDWIETYASVDFEGLATQLEALLDELATPGPKITRAYRYAMNCELDFFSAF